MNDWQAVKAAHATDDTFQGRPLLWVEQFGRRFAVVDIEGDGPYAGHNASTFYDNEPIFLEKWGGVKGGDVVVDAGACFGAYTLPALAAGAFVYACEPSAMHAEVLGMNIEANGWRRHWVESRTILGDGEAYPEGLRAYAERSGFGTVSRTDTIDRWNLQRCDWLKIDVEGLELAVIVGALRTIKRCLPTLIIEDHDGIDPGNPVSDYPASIGSSEQIRVMLAVLGYDLELSTHDATRKYIFARHPNGGAC